MALSIQQFQTEVRRRGAAKPNRFNILITVPPRITPLLDNQNLISLFCESTQLPTQTIGTRNQRIYGPATPRPFSVEYGGESIPATLILDRDMTIKAFFDAWMSLIVNPNSFNVNYPDEYRTRIRISQLDEQENEKYAVILTDAFPKSLSLMEVNQSTQNQVHKLTVNFTYRKWEPVHVNLDKISKGPRLLDIENNPREIYTGGVQLFNVPDYNDPRRFDESKGA